jgi:hypothetical protein
MLGEFILTLLHAVTNTHILHFRAPTNAEHEQLGEFYPKLSDLIDSLVEAIQGRYGLIDYPVSYYVPEATGLEELQSLQKMVDDTRHQPEIPQDSEIQNIIDEIASQIDSTLNKLKHYK